MIGLIPARGGSRTVLDKNLLSWDGKYPAVISAARLAGDFCKRVIVSTDSPEIAAVAQAHGYEVHNRDPVLADDRTTIDQLVGYFQSQWRSDLLVVLPTAAGVTPDDVSYLISAQKASFPAESGALTVPTHGLIYQDSGLLTPRINRQGQQLEAEIGVRYVPYGRPVDYYQPVCITSHPIVEIDTPMDLVIARHRPKKIAILYLDPSSSPSIGTGHKRRSTALARELQHHDVQLIPVQEDRDLMEGWFSNADVHVLDILDTSRKLVSFLASESKVLTIEDLGDGAEYADATINALYDPAHTKYADLRPEFWGLRHEEFASDKTNVLIVFGGTDPARLGDRFHGALIDFSDCLRIQQITPDAPVNMAKAMMDNHILITSAGRTLHEAAYLGIPTISIAANVRETTHCHLGPQWGNVYLGHHETVTDDLFLDAFERLLRSSSWRRELVANRYLDHFGVQRLAKLVERLADE